MRCLELLAAQHFAPRNHGELSRLLMVVRPDDVHMQAFLAGKYSVHNSVEVPNPFPVGDPDRDTWATCFARGFALSSRLREQSAEFRRTYGGPPRRSMFSQPSDFVVLR